MKKILITGCAGFIGSHLTENLVNKGFEVYGIDNFDPFYDINLKKHNLSYFIKNSNFHFIETDLSNKSTLSSVFPDDIDIIVHLAGKAGVRPSFNDVAGFINSNIIATQNLLEEMKDRNISKLVFASSSSVYGNNIEIPFLENMDVSYPISPYAATKKACELLNYTYYLNYKIDIINLRFFTVYGPRQRPDLAIHKFTRLIKECKPITMYGDGDTARDYTYIDDIISGILYSMYYLLKNNKVFEIINLGNNKPVMLTEMINILYSMTGFKPNIIHEPMQPGDVNITYADISKAKSLLRYNPKLSLKQGIKIFLEWYDKYYEVNSI